MRILNIAQTYFPYLAEGGRPVKVRTISHKLVQRGHSVTVLTANLGSAEWSQVQHGRERSSFGWRMAEEGVDAVYLPSWLRYRALTFNPDVVRFCRTSLQTFDLVHFYGLYDLLGPSVSYFCRRRKLPYVIEPLGMYRPIERNVRLKSLWHTSMGRAFLRNAARIIANSELEYGELLEDSVPADKLVMRYDGIDLDEWTNLPTQGTFRARWNIPPSEPLILFLSRLIPRKGADLLIEAFATVCPDSGRLVITGPQEEPAYQEHLKKCAKQCGVEARVTFTGPLYNEDKRALFADSDLFVLPSRYENFAIAAAEAMACGVPVIVSESCGIGSLVRGEAGLVIAPEKQPLIEAMRRLLNDRNLYARLKEGCYRVAGKLAWEQLAAETEGYYARVLAGNNGIH